MLKKAVKLYRLKLYSQSIFTYFGVAQNTDDENTK